MILPQDANLSRMEFSERTGMAETLPIEIAPIAAAASKLSVTFFIVKSPFFLEKPDHRLLRTRNGRALRLCYK